MSCTRVAGNWDRARLIISGIQDAQLDDHFLQLDPPASGVLTGRFLQRHHPAANR